MPNCESGNTFTRSTRAVVTLALVALMANGLGGLRVDAVLPPLPVSVPDPPGMLGGMGGDIFGGHIGYYFDGDYFADTGNINYDLDLAVKPSGLEYIGVLPGAPYAMPGRFRAVLAGTTIINEGLPGGAGFPLGIDGWVTARYGGISAWSMHADPATLIPGISALHGDTIEADYETCCLSGQDGDINFHEGSVLYLHATTEVYHSDRMYGTNPWSMYNGIQTCQSGTCTLDLPNLNAAGDALYAHDTSVFTNMPDLYSVGGSAGNLVWDNTAYAPSTTSAHQYNMVQAAEMVYANMPSGPYLNAPFWDPAPPYFQFQWQPMGYTSHAFMLEKGSGPSPTWDVPTANLCDDAVQPRSAPGTPTTRITDRGFYDGEDVIVNVHVAPPTVSPPMTSSALHVAAVPRGAWVGAPAWEDITTGYVSGNQWRVTIPWEISGIGGASLVTNAFAPSSVESWGIDCLLHVDVDPNPGVELQCPHEITVPGRATLPHTLKNIIIANRTGVAAYWEPQMMLAINYTASNLTASHVTRTQTRISQFVNGTFISTANLEFTNIPPGGPYKLNITVNNGLRQENATVARSAPVTDACDILVKVIDSSEVAWVGCNDTDSPRLWFARRFVPATIGEVDLEFIPPAAWNTSTAGFEITSITHNGDSVYAPDTRHTVWNGTSAEIVTDTVWRWTLRATGTGPPVTGVYNITVEGYNTHNRNLLKDTCLISITVYHPPPKFTAGPCQELEYARRVDAIPGLPSRSQFTAAHQGHPSAKLRFSSADGETWESDPQSYTITSKADLTLGGPRLTNHTYIAYDTDPRETQKAYCTVNYVVQPYTWASQGGSSTEYWINGNDPSRCAVTNGEWDTQDTDARRSLRVSLTDGMHSEDNGDMRDSRALGGVIPYADGILVVGGAWPRFENKQCKLDAQKTTMYYTKGLETWYGDTPKTRENHLAPVTGKFPLSLGGERIVLMGGDKEGGLTYEGWHTPGSRIEYLSDDGQWEHHTDSETGKAKTMAAGLTGAASMVTEDGRLLISGGFGHPQVPVAFMQEYDPESDNITSPTIPEEVAGGRLVACDEHNWLLIAGNTGPDAAMHEAGQASRRTWRTSNGGQDWTPGPSLPAKRAYFAADVSHKLGIILVHGGYSPADAQRAPQTLGHIESKTWVLACDPGLPEFPLPLPDGFPPDLGDSVAVQEGIPGVDYWIEWAPVVGVHNIQPPHVAEHAGGALIGSFYAFGGTQTPPLCVMFDDTGIEAFATVPTFPPVDCSEKKNACRITKDVRRLDIATRIWSEQDRIPTALQGVAGMGYAPLHAKNAIAIAGGRTFTPNGNPATDCYDPVKEAWLYFPVPASVRPIDAALEFIEANLAWLPMSPPPTSPIHVSDILDALNTAGKWGPVHVVGYGGFWMKLPDLPEGLIHPSLEWIGDDLYLVGGDETGRCPSGLPAANPCQRGLATFSLMGDMAMRPSREVYRLANGARFVPWDLAMKAAGSPSTLAIRPLDPGALGGWGAAIQLPLPVVAAPVFGEGACLHVFGGNHAPKASSRPHQLLKWVDPEDTPCPSAVAPQTIPLVPPNLLSTQREAVDEVVATTIPDYYDVQWKKRWNFQHLETGRGHHAMGIFDGRRVVLGGSCGLYYDLDNPKPEFFGTFDPGGAQEEQMWSKEFVDPAVRNNLALQRAFPALLVDGSQAYFVNGGDRTAHRITGYDEDTMKEVKPPLAPPEQNPYKVQGCGYEYLPDFPITPTPPGTSCPAKNWRSFLDGTSHYSRINDVFIDSACRVHVVGQTASSDFPVVGHDATSWPQDSLNGFYSVFDPHGTTLLFSTYIGGTGYDDVESVYVSDGKAYLAGTTDSILKSETFVPNSPLGYGAKDAFVSIVNMGTWSVERGRRLGGDQDDIGVAVAKDNVTGYVYVVAQSQSASNQVAGSAAGYQAANGGLRDALVYELSPLLGTRFHTFLGGITADTVDDAALMPGSPLGRLALVGYTTGPFPTAAGPQTSPGGGQDAFVAAFPVGLGSLSFSTFLGGSGTERGSGIAYAGGLLHVTGTTHSTNFPTLAPLQPSLAGSSDAFWTRYEVATTGITLDGSTYWGGAGTDEGQAFAATGNQVAFVGVTTSTNDFPKPRDGTRFGQNNTAGINAFLVQAQKGGSWSITHSTILGGSQADEATGVSLTAEGEVQVVGDTWSSNFPTTAAAVQPSSSSLMPSGFIASIP
jgi:hypothetical protein